MTSFAKELQTVYNNKRSAIVDNKDVSVDRRNKDILYFFNSQVKDCAKEKMMDRALAGRPTANILDYTPNERFYVGEDNTVFRYTNDEVNYPNYRVADVVMRDLTFRKLLKEFEQELSCAESKIAFSCWKPSPTSCVIEAIWGRNRYHTNAIADNFQMVDRGGRTRGGRSGGRGGGRGGGGRGGDVVAPTDQ